MCIYTQTTYLCKHNIESLVEPCDLGKSFKTSMHDKLIIGIHDSPRKCDACSMHIDLTQPTPTPVQIDLTQDDGKNHIDSTGDKLDYIDLTQDTTDIPPSSSSSSLYQDFTHETHSTPFTPNKRARRDSAIDAYPVMPQGDGGVESHPHPIDTDMGMGS
ncbi:hypothetical protein EG328_009566 [Venturia inaequalis]|uniref:Uncharacterized protein n=1 Tax=Venturia inaequalis TaxID=5025 RepID=A0A8H3U9K0_VENIN|nr:hypothetical protein EG328_009566 [Venturia inaequalis]